VGVDLGTGVQFDDIGRQSFNLSIGTEKHDSGASQCCTELVHESEDARWTSSQLGRSSWRTLERVADGPECASSHTFPVLWRTRFVDGMEIGVDMSNWHLALGHGMIGLGMARLGLGFGVRT